VEEAIKYAALLNWYHLHTQYSVRIPQGSLKYPISFYKSIPIPLPDTSNQKIIDRVEKLVDRILAAKGAIRPAKGSGICDRRIRPRLS
jgi:hypothetical protein